MQEAIWLTAVNEIFKFPKHLDPFSQVNYFVQTLSKLPELPNSKMILLD